MITKETAEKMAIKRWLAFKGWFFYRNLAGLGVYPGIPDLTAIKDGQVVQIEVKIKGNSQSENQKLFQANWEAKGGIYICGDLDLIMEKLK